MKILFMAIGLLDIIMIFHYMPFEFWPMTAWLFYALFELPYRYHQKTLRCFNSNQDELIERMKKLP